MFCTDIAHLLLFYAVHVLDLISLFIRIDFYLVTKNKKCYSLPHSFSLASKRSESLIMLVNAIYIYVRCYDCTSSSDTQGDLSLRPRFYCILLFVSAPKCRDVVLGATDRGYETEST